MKHFTELRRHTTRLLVMLLVFISGVKTVLAESTDPGGGIGGTGITGFGVVQKFGSIFVNGREYFLDGNTRITRDGVPVAEKTLRLGDVVSVQGRIDPATGRGLAAEVNSELALQGAVEKVDAASGTLTVLGQTVRVTPATLGDDGGNAPLARIRPGEHIAVSGFARSRGSWLATRIEPVAAGNTSFVLSGEVQGIDRAHGRLRVAGQELIAVPGTLPAGLAVGHSVRVQGVYDKSALNLEGVADARPMLGPSGRVVEMSGYVQIQPGTGRLVSNGVVLTYSDASIFIGGTAADLRADLPVAVRGELQADGSVAAQSILIDVDPMRVTLPEPAAQAPRAGGDERRAGRDAAEKSDRERPDAGQPGAEKSEIDRPDKPEVEKPEVERPDIERPIIDHPEIEKPGPD